MTVNILQLTVNTDGTQVGSAQDVRERKGKLLAIHFAFSGSAAATTDTVVSCVSTLGGDVTLESLTDTNTSGWRYPRALTNAPGASAGTNDTLIPFCGELKVAVAQGGVSVPSVVVATIYYEA